MLENDEPLGNSIQDFEKWRLKMKIEGLKRKGEKIPDEDLKQYEALIGLSKSKKEQTKSAAAKISSESSTTTETTASKQISIDDLFAPADNSNANSENSKSSRFSSFFKPPTAFD
ncbi:unnamed protein product [[Candida] boidinii]|nr:unnamed protein product [[Candida] boidinii]